MTELSSKLQKAFELEEIKDLDAIHTKSYLYQHKKTGAQVLFLSNEDDNKSFTISFRTPPYDDNGIAHIIEHSVLNGSEKYPSKEPFVDLLKGSLNTFLNAMTFSDKTIYPVASRNEKDFENLMAVYLDAVFHPNLYKDPQILMQEGWHYHLENLEDPIIYKGVVYNEMRGAYSQAESELDRLVEKELFPDTVYANNSGGLPEAIPSLTQEKFIDFHTTYYHPSNAKVILYGNLNLEVALTQLDDYFDQYEPETIEFESLEQAPFEQTKEITAYYSVSEDEPTDNRSLINMNWAIGNSFDAQEALAMNILEELLIGSNTAPIKKVLLKSGLGSDVTGGYAAYTFKPIFDITLKDTNPEAQEKVVALVREELERLVKEGIPKKAVQAALNKVAFIFKEATALEGSTPKGIGYAIRLLTAWAYDGSPYDSFNFPQHLEQITKEIDQGYFENLIQKYLLDNQHSTVISLVPKPGLGAQKEADLAKKLQDYKDSLSDSELEDLVAQTQALIERQGRPDSVEDLAKIPHLTITDLEPKAEVYPLNIFEEEQDTFLHSPGFTAGISYITMYFDMRSIPTPLLPATAFLSELLTEVATKSFSEDDLSTEIDFYTGGISTNTTVLVESVKDAIYYPKFTVQGKALTEYVPQLLNLIQEVLLTSKLDSKDKVKEILLNSKASLEMNLNHASHIAAARRLESYYSVPAKYNQFLSGLDYYDYIADLAANLDERLDQFIEDIKQVSQILFTRQGLVTAFVGSEEDFSNYRAVSKDFYASLSGHELDIQPFEVPVEILNEGFKTAQEIQYVAKGYNQLLLGDEFSGSNYVLKNILGLDYLWNTIRVKGGAYGGFDIVNNLGDNIFLSYRDPNLVQTLKNYDDAVAYLENFESSQEDFEKYVIGTFSDLDRPLSVVQKGSIAVNRYLTHVSQEKVQEQRQQVLETTPQDMKNYAPILKKMMDKNALVVIGNSAKIDKDKDVFKNVRNLIK